MPGVIHAKQFFASGGGKKMSEGFVGEGKGEYFGSRSRRDTARHPKAKKKSGRDSVLTTAVTPSKSPRFRSHNLWGEYDPEHPSSPTSPTAKRLADRRSASPSRPRANSPDHGGSFSTPARNLDRSFGSVADGQGQSSGAEVTRWSNVDFETSEYADRRLGIDPSLDERRNGYMSPTFSSVVKSVWGPTPVSPVNMDLEVSTLRTQLREQDSFSQVHSVTPSVQRYKTPTNPLRTLQVAPRGHGMRAFWGDTIHDAKVEPDGALDGAGADWQIMAQTATGTYSPEHDKCATMGVVSIYNHESLSTFKHHNDPAQDWAMVAKEAHPYDEEEIDRIEFLIERAQRGRLDPEQLRREQLQLDKPYEGEPLEVGTASRPISMSIPGHQVPHADDLEGLRARGQLADHVETRHEPKYDMVESLGALKAELAARDPASSSAKPYSTPIPVGHEGRQGSLKQADSLQAKIPLDHHNTHRREQLRQQLVRHEHEATEGATGHQHYSGHPHPSDGNASLCSELQGHKNKRMVPGKQAGLAHRPDTAEGMARRTDHLTLVAAVHSEPTLRRGTRGDAKQGQTRPAAQHRDLYVSPAGDAAAKAAHPVPPQGHFRVHHQKDEAGRIFHSFRHDASAEWQDSNVPEHRMIYRGTERAVEPTQHPEPGQIAGYRAHGSGVRAVRVRKPERHPNTTSSVTYVLHEEERTRNRYNHHHHHSQESIHETVFTPPTESTPPPGASSKHAMGGTQDVHRAAVGAGPSKRAISPRQHNEKSRTLSVHDRIYLTDQAVSRADPARHGSERPF